MGVFSKNDRQLKVFYNSNALNGREAKSYLTAAKAKMLLHDTASEPLTELQWAEIMEGLETPLQKYLLTTPIPSYKNTVTGQGSLRKTG